MESTRFTLGEEKPERQQPDKAADNSFSLKLQPRHLWQASVLLSCLAVAIKLTATPYVFAFVFAVLIWHVGSGLLERRGKLPVKPKLLSLVVFSVFWGCALSLGCQLVFTGFRADMEHNYINLDAGSILAGLLVAALSLPLIVRASVLTTSTDLLREDSGRKGRAVFLISWAAILLAWIPYLLVYNPGGIVGDGALTLEEALSGQAPRTNHWSVAYVLVLRACIWVGKVAFGDIQAGIFLWVVLASIAVSASLAAVSAALWRRGANKILVMAVVATYAFCGFFASYAMSLWKDGTFGAAVLLLVLLLWDFADQKCSPTKKQLLAFVVLGFFLSLWRSNGLYLYALSVLGCVVILKAKAKRLLVFGIATVLASAAILGPVYRSFGIGNDGAQQSISIPLQQLAAVVNSDRPLTDEQKDILFDILPEETWRTLYSPGLSDDLKNSIDGTKITSQLPGMFKVWCQLLPANFDIYVQSYLLQTAGFWQPFCWKGRYKDYWTGIQDRAGRGYMRRDLIRRATCYDASTLLEENMRFISSGSMVWLLFLVLALILSRRSGRSKRLLPLVPLVAGWCVIMVATPIAYAYRYVVFLPMALPILLALPFGAESIRGEQSSPKALCPMTGRRRWTLAAVVFAGVCLLSSLIVLTAAKRVRRMGGEAFNISFSEEGYNAKNYVVCGLGRCEERYTWTTGFLLGVDVPAEGGGNERFVRVDFCETLGGAQRWRAKQGDRVVGEGCVTGKGAFSFPVLVGRDHLAFSLEFPDARRPCDLNPKSTDSRLLALKLVRIRIEAASRSEDRGATD